MTIKEIRLGTGQTQQVFAEQYGIPLQTLKQWESSPGSSSHREPPDYVIKMLDALTGYHSTPDTGYDDYLISAAALTADNAKHWLRYLRKIFREGKVCLSAEQLSHILTSGKLTMYQRISLLRAIEPGSPTNRYVRSLNEPAQTPLLDKLRRKYTDV